MSTGAIAKEMSAKKVARKHIASNFDKKTVNAKLKANFNNGKLKQSISVSLRMKKDEVIWLKGSKFITVFKAKITPTSVSYYSPFAKNYFEGDFSMIKELLGVIRTQELLAARRIDGGSQMFTRANDFGYSKNAEDIISSISNIIYEKHSSNL